MVKKYYIEPMVTLEGADVSFLDRDSNSPGTASAVGAEPRSAGSGLDAHKSQQLQPSSVQLFAKRSLDVAAALLFFVFLGPLYLFVALLVVITMGYPIHYWQSRLGLGGRRFRFFKFRSMVCDSDAVLEAFLRQNDKARTEWDTFQKLQNDPRITGAGRFIRKLSLDELPQFWNVLIGDMSLVGPRPCMERQRTLYGDKWPAYCAMRPGITGLWQVSGRNKLSYAQRVELDAEYVRNWSFWYDFTILAKTVRCVLTGDGST